MVTLQEEFLTGCRGRERETDIHTVSEINVDIELKDKIRNQKNTNYHP